MNGKPGVSGEMYRTNRQLWSDHLAIHKKKIQQMSSGSDRWHYICSHEVNSSHCEPLERHCRQIGLDLVKDKLDWSAFRAEFDNIGIIPEPPELSKLQVVESEAHVPRFRDGSVAPF